MKKILTLLLMIPLTAFAAEHAGKAAEHGGKAMKSKEQVVEHGAKAAETMEDEVKKVNQDGAKAIQKKEYAGKPAAE